MSRALTFLIVSIKVKILLKASIYYTIYYTMEVFSMKMTNPLVYLFNSSTRNILVNPFAVLQKLALQHSNENSSSRVNTVSI
jgi:hypothetical protein